MFYEEEFTKLGETYFVTDDGSKGSKGFVTDLLNEFGSMILISFIQLWPAADVKSIESMYEEKKGYFPLKNEWAAALALVLLVFVKQRKRARKRHMLKVCSDGPVFPRRGCEIMNRLD